MEEIVSAVSRGVVNGKAITRSTACKVQVYDFSVEGSPFNVDDPAALSRKSVDNFIGAIMGRQNRNMMVMFSPGRTAVVAMIDSEKSDAVLKGIHRQLREASIGQFTKTRPGHLSVQLQDLSAEEMEDLAKDIACWSTKATGLQVMTSNLLQSENRSPIHSAAYRSHSAIVQLNDHPGASAGKVSPLTYGTLRIFTTMISVCAR